LRGLLLALSVASSAAGAAAAQTQGPQVETEPATGMAFARLPGGCFEMGDLDAGVVAGRVCVDAFAIGLREVTNAQYRRFRPGHKGGSYGGQDLNGDDQPAVNLTWRDATAYAEWLGREAGRRFRLPTEAEWEYAARAGSTTVWPWGSTDDQGPRFANLRRRSSGDPSAPADGRPAATSAVGSLEPNAFGLHDMVGNASEWVADTYTPGGDRYGSSLKNPVVNVTSSPLRVRRGGSFDDPPRLARAGARDFYAAEFAVPQTGFRLVMEEP
jgi:formylglycine-generating enzyme required for sulfatase activity